MRAAVNRRAVQRQAQSRSYPIVPAVRGWIANEPLANGKPGGAYLLENWFPLQNSIRLRGGSRLYATVNGGDPVYSMFVYRSGTLERFFAATETDILDITTVGDAGTVVSAYYILTNPLTGAYLTNPDTGAYLLGDLRPEAVTGQTSGYYSTAMFGNVGGDFLSAVNGTDIPQKFDGTAWEAHAFTGSGLDATKLSFVWSYGSRLWYIEKNSLKVWYLPVDSINGAMTSFSLAGIFQEGGSLVMGGKWSLDAGDGLDDKWFVITTTGEVAVYQGTNPGDAAEWSKVGVYKVTPPMGPKALTYAGGDPLIATEDGLVPLSAAVNKDEAALSLAAVSQAIEPEWKKEVQGRSGGPWELLKWPSRNMMIVSFPGTSARNYYCLVCNIETGAWTKFTGWNTQCMALFDDNGFFASNDGKVYRMESGGSDDGLPYTCTYVALPDHMKAPGAVKTIHSMRTTVETSFDAIVQVSASVNYQIDLPPAPDSGPDIITGARWDQARWDQARWDSEGSTTIKTEWASIGKTGFAISQQVQVTCGFTAFPDLKLIVSDAVYEAGAVFA